MNKYIHHGVTALGQSMTIDPTGWFNGHVGAAMLSGAFIIEENLVPKEIIPYVEKSLDRLISKHSNYFEPIKHQTKVDSFNELLDEIDISLNQLSTSGHGVIFATLLLKAFRLDPSLCTREILDGFISMLPSTREDRWSRYRLAEDYRTYQCKESFAGSLEELCKKMYYSNTENIYPNQNGYFFVGENQHGITHSQAILDLKKMGYDNFAQKGMKNLLKQYELNKHEPHDKTVKPPRQFTPLEKKFWQFPFEDPHYIKVAYASLSLIRDLNMETDELERLYELWGASE